MKRCSKCKINTRKNNGKARYCLKCHSEYMKKWRSTHFLSEEQKLKERCRAYTRVYLKRGKIEKKNCERCSDVNSQIHHLDYKKPLKIMWVCRECHIKEHSME